MTPIDFRAAAKEVLSRRFREGKIEVAALNANRPEGCAEYYKAFALSQELFSDSGRAADYVQMSLKGFRGFSAARASRICAELEVLEDEITGERTPRLMLLVYWWRRRGS